MKLNRLAFYGLFLFLFSIGLTACTDSNAVIDTNQEINKRTWSYVDKVKIPVDISDNQATYNLYINLRHSADYKYSNIFILIHQTSPDGKQITERKEIKLALPDGEWLGKGSGSLYSYQVLVRSNYRFARPGKYIFELEQNMRDNPLREVTDAGIRIEKANNSK